MHTCETCGEEIRPGALFCRSCGQAVSSINRDTVDLRQEHDMTEADPDIPEQPETFEEDENLLLGGDVQESVDQVDDPTEEHAVEEEDDAPNIEPSQAALVLQGRYQVVRLISQEEKVVFYEALDLMRCWNCLALQVDQEERFCESCGAELLKKAQVQLRALPASEDEEPEDAGDWFEEDGVRYQVILPTPEAEDSSIAPTLRLLAGYKSDPGKERDINEDSLMVLQLDALCEMRNSPVLGFFAVADGIGGHAAGEVASRVAIHTLAAEVMQQIFVPEVGGSLKSVETLASMLENVVRAANQEILNLRTQAGEEMDMGCTLTAVLICGSRAIAANVGDSRTYRMSNGKLVQITRDHSIAARLLEQNLLTQEEVYSFPQKSVIYRSLGDKPDLEVDTFVIDLEPGDRLLLCSDGLWEMVDDSFIEDVLLEQFIPQQASERLVELANLAGGDDNISVVVVDVRKLA